MRMPLVLLALCLACGDKDDADDGDDGADGADAADGTDGTDAADGADGTEDSGSAATDPSPWTLTVSGALEQEIVFDQPTCSRPNGSANLRQFWRGAGHVFVLKVELMGVVDGAGTWTEADGVRATLQEEAGGSGAYFAAGPADAIELVIESLDDDAGTAWGTWTVSGMADTAGGTITLAPQPLPVWCPAFL